jgi:hypothetical protein
MPSDGWLLTEVDVLYVLATLAIAAAVMSLGPDPWIPPP